MRRIIRQPLDPVHHQEIFRLGGDLAYSRVTEVVFFEMQKNDYWRQPTPTVWFEVEDVESSDTIKYYYVTVVEDDEPYVESWKPVQSLFDRSLQKAYHLLVRDETPKKVRYDPM